MDNINLTNSEWYVLDCLWERSPQTVMELVSALNGRLGWAKSTTITTLRRMEAKGLVSIRKDGSPHVYRAALSREDCQSRERETFLRRVYRGAAGDLVAAFLKESPISPREREELRRLLDKMEV